MKGTPNFNLLIDVLGNYLVAVFAGGAGSIIVLLLIAERRTNLPDQIEFVKRKLLRA